MGKPAARITDMHVCPMVTPGTPPIPHVGGPVVMGSENVFTGKLPQARVGDQAVCVGPPDVIAMGSTGVFVNKKPAARIGDLTAHGGTIVAGLPTVLIGETVGGGGGGAGALTAGAAMMQFTDYAAQVQVLIDAFRAGSPFCEVCFKNALAKLKAPPPAPAAKAPPPAPVKAQPPPAKGPTIGPSNTLCELESLKVTCSHGRASGPENILCVVPGGAAWADSVKGELSMKGGCGTHPAWTVSGPGGKSGKGASFSFDAVSDTRQPSSSLASTSASEHATYSVSGEGCGGGAPSVSVEVYPPDEVSLGVDFMKAVEKIKSVFTRTGAVLGGKGEGEFAFLHGSISASMKWKEAKDWRCYRETKISGGFNPLLSGSVKLPFYKAVPPPLSKVVDLQAYFTVKGSCQITPSLVWEHWPHPADGGKSTVFKVNKVEGGGEFRFGIGASASAAETISITIEGTSGASVTAAPAHQDYPAAKVEWTVGDGRFDVTVEWPWAIEMKFAVSLWPGWTGDDEWRFDETKS